MSHISFHTDLWLFGELVNDLILRLAKEHLYAPYWSQQILDELRRKLQLRIGEERSAQRVNAMTAAFPEALVIGYESLIKNMTCDEKDRHVLAAADYSPAQTLVTFNTKDFPETSTQPLRIEVKRPDDFFLDVLDLDPGRVARVCHTALLSYKRYPQTPEDYADMLRKSGVPEFVNCLYPILDALSLN